jgi:hypothetical protein
MWQTTCVEANRSLKNCPSSMRELFGEVYGGVHYKLRTHSQRQNAAIPTRGAL